MHREPYGKYAQECQGVKAKESCFQEKLNLFTQSPFLELDFCRFLSPIFDSLRRTSGVSAGSFPSSGYQLCPRAPHSLSQPLSSLRFRKSLYIRTRTSNRNGLFFVLI